MTLDLPRRFPWPTLLSVGIHGAVVAGLLYTSVHQVIELPAPAQPISVTMVTPADLEPPQAVQPPPEPVVEPEPEPEPIPEPPKEAPVVIEQPKPKPKPKPKPVKKVEEQPKRDVKPAEPRPASPFENTAPARPTTSTAPATTKPAVSAPSGPRALSRNQPQYPARAQALRIEGRVKVKFDVTPDGRVENVEVLSAQPANMFEREVKNAMRRWRYEAGKPGSGLVVNIVFRLNGTTQIE
ncbi:transport protein TonB [Citrobacter freundii]|uniref:TonB system transport protein TonB n=1 Tax=Citrobacter braakii TaxID=57706 RepID=UPI000DF0F626|nr:TonB system transport protein TonB [Citrobacter braakii]MBJ9238306.1 TonB system transport protein TonB [Citrobacter braakii]STB59279.1 transport protein TonB [Citrobacter freundii]SUX73418.1 transport protein TonB [Citrobacter freundii]